MITLPRTLQTIFNIVATHLMSQMQVCRNDDAVCQYRHNGLKCAAGALISDEEYTDFWERKSWRTIVLHRMAPREFLEEIVMLQTIHDINNPTEWKDKLIEFGEMHQLDLPECLK
jgi:hypothetical protein